MPQAWALLGRLRPRAVFTSGGYLGIPLVLAARARGIRPGLGGQRGSGAGNRGGGPDGDPGGGVVPADAGHLPGALIRVRHADQIVRGTDRHAARRSFGVGADDRLLLVFGGSQAVARITDALAASLERLLDSWRVLHITGEAGLPAAEATRAWAVSAPSATCRSPI